VNTPAFFSSFNGAGPALGGIQTNGAVEPAGGWTWITGEPWNYTNWSAGQPDNGFGTDENRLHFFSGLGSTPGATWNDLGQNDPNLGGYVIEHDPVPVVAATNLAYFPEEPLKTLVGDNAYGLWKLEIWDSRVGATNPAPQLVSWQLSFILETNAPVITPLTDGIPVTNTLPACFTAFFLVDVPTWANYVTNRLLFATPPGVNVYFDQTTLPAPGGTNVNDFPIIPGPSTSGSFTLYTNSLTTNGSTPPLLPGSRYFLAVENPCANGTNVTFAIQVDFSVDAIVLTNMVPYTNSNSGATNSNSQLYVYGVTTNAARVQFEINGSTADMTLVARRGLPPPSLGAFDYDSANPTTNDELIVVITNSVPIALSPGNWYLNAYNISGGPAAYSIMASEWPVTGRPFSITNMVIDTNGFCLTWTSLPLVHYYLQGKTTLSDPYWYKATQTLTATNDFHLECVDLPSPFQFFRVAEGLSLFDVIEPLPVVKVNLVTNGVSLLWIDSVTARYEVQWTPALAPPVWGSFTNAITSTNGWFSFVDDGTQSGGLGGIRFYRVRQLLPP
jgi:hypothetical protein